LNLHTLFTKSLKLLHIARRPYTLRALWQGVAAGVEHEKILRLLDCACVVDIGANRGQFALVNHQDSSQPGFPFVLSTFGFAGDGGWTGPHDSLVVGTIADRIVFLPPRTPPSLPGDANVDGVVDAADVVFLVNEAMPDDKPILLPQNFANADLDQDVDVDQDDLEALVQLLVGEMP